MFKAEKLVIVPALVMYCRGYVFSELDLICIMH